MLFVLVTVWGDNGRAVDGDGLRIDEHKQGQIKIGDFGVVSPDSGSVVYYESRTDELWEIGLVEKPGKRRRIQGAGQPLGVSRDGKLMLTSRTTAENAWSIEGELWIVDRGSKTATQLKNGHGAVFFGPKSENVAFHVGSGSNWFFVTTVDGKTTTRIECTTRPSTHLLPVLNGRGLLFASFSARRKFDVVFIHHENLRATTIASVGPGGVWFKMPKLATKSNN